MRLRKWEKYEHRVILLLFATCRLLMLHQNQLQQRHVYIVRRMIHLRNHSSLHQVNQFEILNQSTIFENIHKRFFLLGGTTSALLIDDNENNREGLLMNLHYE